MPRVFDRVVVNVGVRAGQHVDSREHAIGARDRADHYVGVDRGVALVQDDAMEAVVGEGIAHEGRALGQVVDADVVGGDRVAHHHGSGGGLDEHDADRLVMGL